MPHAGSQIQESRWLSEKFMRHISVSFRLNHVSP